VPGLGESAMELLIFAEKGLPDSREEAMLRSGSLPRGGMLERLVSHLLPHVAAQACAVRFFGDVGEDAGSLEGVRPRLLEIGRASGRDFSDVFHYSVTGRSFRHPHLGVGTIVKVVDREAPSQSPDSARRSSPADMEDELARFLSEEGPPESAPEPVASPAPGEPGRERAVVHLLVLAEQLPEDEKAQAAKEHRLPAGGQIEDTLRREIGYPLRDDLPVALRQAGGDKDWGVENVRALVSEAGRAMGFDYADRSLFAVRSRRSQTERLGRVLLVSVLRRQGAPAPSAQPSVTGEGEIQPQDAPIDETEAGPAQAVAGAAEAVAGAAEAVAGAGETVAGAGEAIAERGLAEETPGVTHIGDLPVLERWRETPISQLPVLSTWEESAEQQLEDAGDDRFPAGRD